MGVCFVCLLLLVCLLRWAVSSYGMLCPLEVCLFHVLGYVNFMPCFVMSCYAMLGGVVLGYVMYANMHVLVLM